jgi:CHASE3 domain sensor protein
MSSSISDSQFYDNVGTIGNEINSILTDSTATGLSSDIQEKNTELALKQKRKMEQESEIQEKNKLILTRSRMLQLSQERNIYKKKIIYTLIAIILLLLVLTLASYVFLNKKTSSA